MGNGRAHLRVVINFCSEICVRDGHFLSFWVILFIYGIFLGWTRGRRVYLHKELRQGSKKEGKNKGKKSCGFFLVFVGGGNAFLLSITCQGSSFFKFSLFWFCSKTGPKLIWVRYGTEPKRDQNGIKTGP